MPLISRSEIDLTNDEIAEISQHVLEIWKDGLDTSKLSTVRNCYEAYNLVDTGAINDKDEYYDSLKVILPTAFNALNSVCSSVYSTTIPNNQFLGIERELTGDDLTKMVLLSMRSTDWSSTANQDFMQMGLAGDTYTLFRNKKNFLEAVSLPIQHVRVHHKDNDLSKTNFIVKYKLTILEMFTSEQGYIDEAVFALEEKSKGAGKTTDTTLTGTTVDETDDNPYSFDEKSGQGWSVLEAHIPYLKLRTNRTLINSIIVVTRDGKHLLRFNREPNSQIFNRKMKTGWIPTLPKVFYSTGIIEPILSLCRYLDNIWSIEMITGFENNLSGFMYDSSVPDIEKWIPTWKKGIDTLWGMPGLSQNPNMFQRIPSSNREPYADKAHQVIGSLIDQTTNSSSGISARQSQAQFATQSKLQFQGASMNLSSVARHLDNQYIQRTGVFQYWNIYNQMFKVVSDQYGNVIDKFPNVYKDPLTGKQRLVVEWWLNAIGLDEEAIYKRISNPRYMFELSESINESDIRATGTQASINKAETYQLEASNAQLVAGLPGAQLVKWDKLTRRLFQLIGREPDDYVASEEEMAQQQQAQQQQQAGDQEQADLAINELTSMTNSETGEKLTEEEINQRVQFLMQMGLDENDINELLDQHNPEGQEEQPEQQQPEMQQV